MLFYLRNAMEHYIISAKCYLTDKEFNELEYRILVRISGMSSKIIKNYAAKLLKNVKK